MASRSKGQHGFLLCQVPLDDGPIERTVNPMSDYETGQDCGRSWALGAPQERGARLIASRKRADDAAWARQFRIWGSMAWEQFVAEIAPDADPIVFWEARLSKDRFPTRDILWSQPDFVRGFADAALSV